MQIINNSPLTYFYPNTIETCLTPNHLLFSRQLLHSSNTASTAVRNLTVLSNTTDKINRMSNHFLDRWRYEFTWDTTNTKIKYRLPKHWNYWYCAGFLWKGVQAFWKISTVTQELPNRDSEIRGVIVRVAKTNTILKRP